MPETVRFLPAQSWGPESQLGRSVPLSLSVSMFKGREWSVRHFTRLRGIAQALPVQCPAATHWPASAQSSVIVPFTEAWAGARGGTAPRASQRVGHSEAQAWKGTWREQLLAVQREQPEKSCGLWPRAQHTGEAARKGAEGITPLSSDLTSPHLHQTCRKPEGKGAHWPGGPLGQSPGRMWEDRRETPSTHNGEAFLVDSASSDLKAAHEWHFWVITPRKYRVQFKISLGSFVLNLFPCLGWWVNVTLLQSHIMERKRAHLTSLKKTSAGVRLDGMSRSLLFRAISIAVFTRPGSLEWWLLRTTAADTFSACSQSSSRVAIGSPLTGDVPRRPNTPILGRDIHIFLEHIYSNTQTNVFSQSQWYL